jgi:hypothetical protein
MLYDVQATKGIVEKKNTRYRKRKNILATKGGGRAFQDADANRTTGLNCGTGTIASEKTIIDLCWAYEYDCRLYKNDCGKNREGRNNDE